MRRKTLAYKGNSAALIFHRANGICYIELSFIIRKNTVRKFEHYLPEILICPVAVLYAYKLILKFKDGLFITAAQCFSDFFKVFIAVFDISADIVLSAL